MSYTITYLKGAVEDLTTIAAHYGRINQSLLLKLRNALDNPELRLIRNPFSFSRVDYRDFRRVLLDWFPYKMIYRVHDTEIHIIAVIHQAVSKRRVSKQLRR